MKKQQPYMPSPVYRLEMEPARNSHAWLMTFADLLALLLAFFILSYAMSSFKHGHWDKITHIVGKTFNERRLVDQLVYYTEPLSVKTIAPQNALDLGYLRTIFTDKISTDPFLQNNISISQQGENLLISIRADTLFDPGTSRVSFNASVILFAVAEVLRQLVNKVEVSGYAVKGKVVTQDVSSTDWEKALSRAAVVAYELEQYGALSRIDSLVRHKAPVSEGSIGTGDRVDIIIRQQLAPGFM